MIKITIQRNGNSESQIIQRNYDEKFAERTDEEIGEEIREMMDVVSEKEKKVPF